MNLKEFGKKELVRAKKELAETKKPKEIKKTVPHEPKAKKISNALVKLGMKSSKNFGHESNPYSNSQSLRGYFKGTSTFNKAMKTLESEGWRKEKTYSYPKHGEPSERGWKFTSPEGAVVEMDLRAEGGGLVTIYGKKNAKTSNLPYYD